MNFALPELNWKAGLLDLLPMKTNVKYRKYINHRGIETSDMDNVIDAIWLLSSFSY